jgi:hypothetical protein
VAQAHIERRRETAAKDRETREKQQRDNLLRLVHDLSTVASCLPNWLSKTNTLFCQEVHGSTRLE